MNITYHGTPKRYFEGLDPDRPYLPAAFAKDGFIHCTNGRQAVSIILTEHCGSDPEPYVYLLIDTDRVTSTVCYDDPARVFPHIYGPLNRDAIIAVLPAARAADGTFLMPDTLPAAADQRATAMATGEGVILSGPRVTLRVGRLADAPNIYMYADHPVVAGMTGMPYPYPGVEGAMHWVETTWQRLADGSEVHLAITLTGEDQAIGYVGLNGISKASQSAELGYWIGEPYWGKGLMTEAAQLLVDYGFRELGLNRIKARCRADNRRSYRVMEKLGMQHEGLMRQEAYRDGQFHDQRHYAILRSEWEARRP